MVINYLYLDVNININYYCYKKVASEQIFFLTKERLKLSFANVKGFFKSYSRYI